MVKKLFKHEFAAYARIMLVLYAIVLSTAAAFRLIMCFESDSILYETALTISLMAYFASVFFAAVGTFVFVIVRFYTNLFTAEGYLSFTLPVTPAQHIWVKLLTGLSVSVISILIGILSGCIAGAGQVLEAILAIMRQALDNLYAFAGWHTPFYILEGLLAVLCWMAAAYLLYYGCISVGQMAKKNRILAAVGAYFVYYIASQAVSTVFLVIFSIALPETLADKIGLFVMEHPFAAVHIGMWFVIGLMSLFGFVVFRVIRHIVTKKLNLE